MKRTSREEKLTIFMYMKALVKKPGEVYSSGSRGQSGPSTSRPFPGAGISISYVKIPYLNNTTNYVKHFCIMHSHCFFFFTCNKNRGESQACTLGERLRERWRIKVAFETWSRSPLILIINWGLVLK